MDLVIINTIDNKNYEVIFDNQPIQNHYIRARFLEFEALLLVLMEKVKFYENFIYCNCSIINKHIGSSIKRATTEYMDLNRNNGIPILFGRLDFFDGGYNCKKIPFISTFCIFFNQNAAEIILETLNNFYHDSFECYQGSKSLSYHLAYVSEKLKTKNRTYKTVANEILKLKVNSVAVEKLVSMQIAEKGQLIKSQSLSSRTIRLTEFIKNFFYKRSAWIRMVHLKLLMLGGSDD